MRARTIAQLRDAVEDAARIEEYWNNVVRRGPDDCWHWRGAISGKGHGRFSIGDAYEEVDGVRRRRTFTVIAHRFGFALRHGVDALLRVPLIGHECDNPPCQNPAHWRISDHATNRREYLARRGAVLGPLADTRGARGRAREIRDAARDGVDLGPVELAGASEGHLRQGSLFVEPARVRRGNFDLELGALPAAEEGKPRRPEDQPGLFGS